ncbi:MAG: GNAT family N-acetyltransferase [Parachlamydiales bacterium]|nr:GNAT family N-acetyltransferase [Parachlamydiales bacterium]
MYYLSKEYPPLAIEYRHGGKELTLRALQTTDARACLEAIKSSQSELRRYLAWSHQNFDLQLELQWLKQCMIHFLSGKIFNWGAFHHENGDLMAIGTLTSAPKEGVNNVEMSYWTATRYLNSGLATQICKMLTITSFEIFRCERVEVLCNKSNEANHRVIEKCGFKLESETRNTSPKPTFAMLQHGLNVCRTSLRFALTPDDTVHLPWYQPMCQLLEITALEGTKIELPQLVF